MYSSTDTLTYPEVVWELMQIGTGMQVHAEEFFKVQELVLLLIQQ